MPLRGRLRDRAYGCVRGRKLGHQRRAHGTDGDSCQWRPRAPPRGANVDEGERGMPLGTECCVWNPYAMSSSSDRARPRGYVWWRPSGGTWWAGVGLGRASRVVAQSYRRGFVFTEGERHLKGRSSDAATNGMSFGGRRTS